MRVAAGIEYNGNKFHGWQSQPNLITLQATIETAISKVANEEVKVSCAGRTDRGVHATNQVIHFDSKAIRSDRAWIMGTNSYLPATISLKWLKVLDPSFHARFSALSRRYQYYIYNHNIRSSLFYPLTTWVSVKLDHEKMNQAAQYLRGEHDFSSFRSAQCQSKTAKRHIFNIQVQRMNEFVIIDIVANSFLHHMVRNIVGVLLLVGEGIKPPTWCQEVLSSRDRTKAGRTAPPQGLYLTGVRYADHYALPQDFKSPFGGFQGNI